MASAMWPRNVSAGSAVLQVVDPRSALADDDASSASALHIRKHDLAVHDTEEQVDEIAALVVEVDGAPLD